MNRAIFILVFAVACARQPAPSLVGSWINDAFTVEVNHKSGTTQTFSVTPGTWEETLQLKRIVTEWQPDGSYRSDHFGLEDTLLFAVSGKWQQQMDSITFLQTTPREATYTLQFRISGDTLFFNGYLDWDGDGDSDDHYSGRQLRVKK
jgi:hypothetical protein